MEAAISLLVLYPFFFFLWKEKENLERKRKVGKTEGVAL